MQIHEVIVDNDTVQDVGVYGDNAGALTSDEESNSTVAGHSAVGEAPLGQTRSESFASATYSEMGFESSSADTSNIGFRIPAGPLEEGDNPFAAGTFRVLPAGDSVYATVEWSPEIPEQGEYAVHVSYGSLDDKEFDCVSDARYVVEHMGGHTAFSVNQCISAGTWVYLGQFAFPSGHSPDSARVWLSNEGSTVSRRVTADAVRFGGGMGSVARGGSVSGRPRYLEGARYYLQYAGIPDSLVFDVWDSGDYVDDYRSRGEWVNYLVGAPFGPNVQRTVPGLNVPVDLSLAFHTDAGMAQSDTTIGTLLIYSSTGAEGDREFPDGVSRLANRDLADILQTEIVEDMRRIADRNWPRRPLWDRDYSEAVRPNVPSALLELLAHQNFTDMKFALDPRFRFAISRSIYKGIGRFLAFQAGQPFVAQPLPVSHFAVERSDDSVELSWRAVDDSLEASASPEAFVVYRRVDDGGWDNGVLVSDQYVRLDAPPIGHIHSYRVHALNRGGLSFPSETLAVGRAANDKGHILVVSAFDRIAGPEWFDEGSIAGFPDWLDHGVADRFDISRTGPQYRFTKTVPWTDDDAPGFGASHASNESEVVRGNTFDFAFTHGKSILDAGYSFASVSDEVFESSQRSWSQYAVLDLLLGEEKRTPWPKGVSPPQYDAFPFPLRDELERFSRRGGG
ncbi:MAG: hypothetical protein HKN13_13895, partial [Rhodothermales bacterium]|nr:hypothetical protein [Rhodothermales bacterium]